MAVDFTTSFSLISRSARQDPVKDTGELCRATSQADTCRILQSTANSARAYGTSTKIDHVHDYKAKLVNRRELKSFRVYSYHNGNSNGNNKKMRGKSSSTCKLN